MDDECPAGLFSPAARAVEKQRARDRDEERIREAEARGEGDEMRARIHAENGIASRLRLRIVWMGKAGSLRPNAR
jgi:hypothetical protein